MTEEELFGYFLNCVMTKITKNTDLLKVVDMKINNLNLIKGALQAKGNFTKVELEEYIVQFY